MITDEIKTSIKDLITIEYDEIQKTVKHKHVPIKIVDSIFQNTTLGYHLYEEIEQNPKEILKYLEEQINEKYDQTNQQIQIYLTNLPKTESFITSINFLQAKHLNKLIIIKGTIKRISENLLLTEKKIWKCNQCERKIFQKIKIQTTKNDNEIKVMQCPACKRRMENIDQIKTNQVWFEIEELEADKTGKKSSIITFFKRQLALPENTQQYMLGDNVIIAGRLSEKQYKKESNQSYKIIHGYGIETLEENRDYDITKQEIEEIKEGITKNQDALKYWLNEKKLYQQVKGHEKIKEALIISLIGNNSTKKGAKINRGTINLLIVGVGGTSKSTLLKMTREYALKSRYLTGAGATGVGLTATVVVDKELDVWVVEGGVLPLMHKAYALIDEFDKLPDKEELKLHEPMEDLTVSINKAGISMTLPSETTLICAGNFKQPSKNDLYEQIGLQQTTLSRFDLIFIQTDTTTKEEDEQIADQMLKNWNNKITIDDKDVKILFKKYQRYAKTIEVNLSDDIENKLKSWYVDIKQKIKNAESKMFLTPRALDALIRLTKAHSRANLRSEAIYDDVVWAQGIYYESLRQSAIDIFTGEIDESKLETGIGRGEKKVVDIIVDLITANPLIDYQDLKRMLNADMSDMEIDKVLERLKREGVIFEPHNAKYKMM